MLLNKLSCEELKMIDSYRKSYSMPKVAAAVESPAPIENILRFWSEEKQKLYHLLGDKMMHEESVKISFPKDLLMKQMNKLINEHHFVREVDHYLSKNDEDTFFKLFNPNFLIDNKYNGKSAKIEINGTLIQLHKGAKPLKILSKIATALDIKVYFENFRIRHSQILNQKEISGTLVLSIHPLDYMTMSDNASNWSSCMSWKKSGCYCRGAVEMMNSPCVVIAYLKSDNSMSIGEKYHWNDKKWRTLCIVGEECIATIKDYPFRNDVLSSMVVKSLVKLAKENLNMSFSEEILDYDPSENFIIKGESYTFDFETNTMYNDFDNDPHCFMALRKNLPSGWYTLNYSGVENCMWCGDCYDFYEGYRDANEQEQYLVCRDCYSAETCEYCGDFCTEFFEVDGVYVCKSCYQNCASECADDKQPHLSYTRVFLQSSECRDSFYTMPCLYLYNTDENTLKRFTSLGRLNYNEYSIPYISMHELTEEGLHAFKINNKQDFVNLYGDLSLTASQQIDKILKPLNWVKPDNWDEIISTAEKLAEEKGLQ